MQFPLTIKKRNLVGALENREKRFVEFTHSYTTIIPPIVTSSHKRAYKLLSKVGIDFFITGSDQLWNPYYGGRGYEFLTFAPPEKRLSYAASIGVMSIPDNKIDFYKKNLSDMRYLSVREDSAAELITRLIGREADISLDPTLLLCKSEWEKIIHKPNVKLPQKYICTYFFGEVPEAVSIFANQVQLPICNLNSKDDE